MDRDARDIDDQPICTECGFCCDGTLFPFVLLGEDEAPIPPMQPAKETPRSSFRQPCPHHRGRCSIYADRPSACRHYACDLLRSVMAGETRAEDARETILRLRSLRDSFGAAIGPVQGSLRSAGERLHQQAIAAADPGAFRVRNARALAAYAAMEGLIATAFISTRGASSPGTDE